MAKPAVEVNFDGLVGPTHNYAGLSLGNLASQSHGNEISNPRLAALQGLKKMKTLYDMGFCQGVLPPHDRPCITTLKALGYKGAEAQMLNEVANTEPALLRQVSSASSMWVANAATVSPSQDTADGKVHFTVANLSNKFHRSIEHPTTYRILQSVFSDKRYFSHHRALPSNALFSDEGAANHTRFCKGHGDPGVELFVFGRSELNQRLIQPSHYPARQTLEASMAVARLNRVAQTNVVFAQQHPHAIDAGVFHNDVIAVGNQNVLLYHEQAFLDTEKTIDEIDGKLVGGNLIPICVPKDRVSLDDAVRSYLFNSQLLSKKDGKMLLLLPEECQQIDAVNDYVISLLAADNPIDQVLHMDLKQSMQNGGGPACLRLRVVLTDDEFAAVNPGVLMTESLYNTLVGWVNRHYRERIRPEDLSDPALLDESRAALQELTEILGVGSIYPFQRNERNLGYESN